MQCQKTKGQSENPKKSRKNTNLIFKVMKKVFLAAVVALASLTANAQIWVGGSLGANFNTPDGDDAETLSTYTIAPEVGYKLNDKWDIAVALNFKMFSYDGESENNFSIEPYARFTFAEMDKVSFFVDGGFSFGKENFTMNEDGMPEPAEAEAFTVGVRPGIKFAATDNLSFVAKTGWLGYKNVKDAYSEFGLDVNGNALSFGVYYAF